MPSELKRVKALLDLMHKGELSACQKQLLSQGLHNLLVAGRSARRRDAGEQ